jgi:hypothetical protein
VKAFTGRVNAGDEEMARLWKKNTGLRETVFCPVSRYEIPGNGVPVHAAVARAIHGYEDGQGIGGKPEWVVCAAFKETPQVRAGRPGAIEAYHQDM